MQNESRGEALEREGLYEDTLFVSADAVCFRRLRDKRAGASSEYDDGHSRSYDNDSRVSTSCHDSGVSRSYRNAGTSAR